MVSGTFSIVCCISLIILIYTGWFGELYEELRLARPVLLFCLLGEVFLSGEVISLSSSLQFHLGVLLFFPFLLHILRKTGCSYTVTTSLCLAASLLFLAREWFWMESSGSLYVYRVIAGLIALGVAFSNSRFLGDRMAVVVGGLMVSEGLSLILHRDAFNPILFGHAEFRDFIWAVLSFLLLLHYGQRYAHRWILRFRLTTRRIR
ncbi:hypothetical protein [Paludifilum halophilum]|uniref:Uncharacterized protein n=1 Tax=Paludifilum halophilum TaxID=1642702 RepID=A0A235BBR3_9BACL|nr:hypothetical protein [Paludifilum halophilum]OYD09734.1 hypothetical protein CHM34_01685 [Paludifilum halophilum]